MSDQRQSSSNTESLRLAEMLRIMDVATEMRLQRENVEKEFAIADTKQMLREKLLQATTITGERVTDVEVDAAINSYFNTLYTYREPTGRFDIILARLYVWRSKVTVGAAVLLSLSGGTWWQLHRTARSFSQTVQTVRPIQSVTPIRSVTPVQTGGPVQTVSPAEKLAASIDASATRIRSLARETAVTEELEQWLREVSVARQQSDTATLTTIDQRMSQLISLLNEEYEVRIHSDPNQKSGFPRYFDNETGRHPAYYLIVSAKTDQGQLLHRTIRNAETDQSSTVTAWAEQVPKEVYDRIAADKKADGILNETLFAVKQRGFREPQVRINGADGKALAPLGQITAW